MKLLIKNKEKPLFLKGTTAFFIFTASLINFAPDNGHLQVEVFV